MMDDGLLAIHVINAGIGESIVVQLPTGRWGVVDCYAPSLEDPSSNPTLQFLREQGVKELEFLCLTHPHDDHYRGMNHLLDGLKIHHFWRFGAFVPQDLKLILTQYFKLAAVKREDEKAKENADELSRVLGKVLRLRYEEKNAERKIEKIIELADLKHVYPFPKGMDLDFEITAIAPSTDLVKRYENDLRKCFDAQGKLVEKLPHQRHNDVSVALIIRFGKTVVVLGGDVEKKNWVDALGLLSLEQFSAHGVKVSHHGSTTGYTAELWQHFSAESKPIAVLTPYRRFKLPKREALDHINKHVSVLLTTCRSAMTPDDSTYRPFLKKHSGFSRALMAHRFRGWHAVTPPAGTGICSLFFDRNGAYRYECAGEACPVD